MSALRADGGGRPRAFERTAIIPYRSDIDGLRAIAVFAVIFHHAEFLWARGGYIGVDVFFVISIDLTSVFCDAHRCPAGTAERPFYVDDNHVSADGAVLASEASRPLFEEPQERLVQK